MLQLSQAVQMCKHIILNTLYQEKDCQSGYCPKNLSVFVISKRMFSISTNTFLKKCRYFQTKFDGRGIFVFLDDHFFNLSDFHKATNPLKIPTPTPAPDHLLGGHNELSGTSVEWAWGKRVAKILEQLWHVLRYSYGQFLEKICLKFCSIILLQFGLITFRFAYGRTQKPSFLWFRDFWTRRQAQKRTIFIFEDTRTFKKHQ